MKATLERLVDFDLINSGITRFSVGAVNVHTGNFVYSTTHACGPGTCRGERLPAAKFACHPRGPYKFYNRAFVIISYRTDPNVLREVVPEPLEVIGDVVNYEFIRTPDSTGFGDIWRPARSFP